MTKPLAIDICFIGGGSSVASAIAFAAASGLSVALVETGTSDGTRARLVRSLALAAFAREAETLRRAVAPAAAEVKPEGDFARIARHLHDMAAIPADSTPQRFAALGVRYVSGAARFKDRRTLVAGDVELRARRFVIGTGTLAAPPSLDGLDSMECLTEDAVFELTHRPGHLIVVGGGQGAVELAQVWRRLGSDVTLVAAEPLLAGCDPEMAAVVLRRLVAEGVTILENATVNEIQASGKGAVRVQVLSEGNITALDGTHLLKTGHRVPNIAGLDLRKAGVKHNGSGIAVSPALRTSNARIYAIGDVIGPRHLAHVVEHQAERVVRGLLSGRDEEQDMATIPAIVFTDPGLAHVGAATEGTAPSNRGVRILRWPYAANQRAFAEAATAGHVKLVADKEGKVLGVTIAGADAAEMIGFWVLAMTKNVTVGDVAGLALPASIYGEIGKRAAIAYFPAEPRRSIGRKLAGLLRVFG
jgi:pyruvate/2-oxoglutarate dehydrogenase complex dihydrolipoamide dehydrogenase (E3) component